MLTVGIRVFFASGRVQVFTPYEYAHLPSAWLLGARTELVNDTDPVPAAQRPGWLARFRTAVGNRVDRFLRWLAVTL